MSRKQNFEPLKISRYILIGVGIVALLILNYWYLKKYLSFNSSYVTDYQLKEDNLAQYRHPAVAGLFYASSPEKLSRNVDKYLEAGRFENYTGRQPKMIIVPHAGYIYSAGTAAKAYALLQRYAGVFKNVILVGPAHYAGGNKIYLSDVDYFKTPLGKVKVNKSIVHQLVKKNKNFVINNKAHAKEHSLEVQLPFLQKVLPAAKIVPIIYGKTDSESLAKGLKKYLSRKNVLIVISADLSHYYNYPTAQELDGATAQKIVDGQPLDEHESCGAIGINAGLELAKKANYHPQILELINSGDTGGDKSSVVGYGAWSFYPDAEPAKKLSPLEREIKNLEDFSSLYNKNLRHIVKVSLARAVKNHKNYSPSRSSYPEEIFDRGATFVTLSKNGSLRGCVGSVLPTMSVAQNIADNTYAAALEDKRFPPVTFEELNDISFTISLLTSFEEIKYHNERDLLNKIQENTDGVVIRDGNRQGVFLPTVWKEIPDKEEFFKQLKLKAGMNPNYWNNRIKVYHFRTVEIKDEN